MSLLIRGIIISIFFLGIGALLLFPETTFNKVVIPVLDSVLQITEIKEVDKKDSEAVKSQSALSPPLINPDPNLVPVIISNTENSDTQIQSKQTEQMASLQPPPNSLEGSDAMVISLVNDINPKLKEWIKPAEQIRKWVASIDRIAQGKLSTKYRPFTFKVSTFKVITKNGRLYPDPENYKRFNPLIDVITSVRPDLLVNYYRYWLPIFDKAYAELGNGTKFSQRLRQAMDNILIVNPLVGGLTELKRPTSITYKYINTEIENSSDITKWVWRIGPENAAIFQKYLREFTRLLDS